MTILRLTYDPSVWLPVPDGWPTVSWPDPAAWAREMAGRLDDSAQADLATAAFAAVAEARVVDSPADLTFVHVAPLDLRPTTVDLALLPAVGDAEVRHRELGRGDQPGYVGAIEVSPVTALHLGAGTGVLRFDPVPIEDVTIVVGTLRMFWRIEATDVAVSLNAGDPGTLLGRVRALTALLSSVEPEPVAPDSAVSASAPAIQGWRVRSGGLSRQTAGGRFGGAGR